MHTYTHKPSRNNPCTRDRIHVSKIKHLTEYGNIDSAITSLIVENETVQNNLLNIDDAGKVARMFPTIQGILAMIVCSSFGVAWPPREVNPVASSLPSNAPKRYAPGSFTLSLIYSSQRFYQTRSDFRGSS